MKTIAQSPGNMEKNMICEYVQAQRRNNVAKSEPTTAPKVSMARCMPNAFPCSTA